nr:MAG TPA: anti-CRISPR protein [Caudoviricetes sp.]
MSKNNIFNRYPAIIHGEARSETDEFVVHTRYPRFLARKSFDDDYTGTIPENEVNGDIVKDSKTGRLTYRSNIGLWLSDFIFFDNNHPEVTAEWLDSLKKVCDQITADDLMLSEDGDLYD